MHPAASAFIVWPANDSTYRLGHAYSGGTGQSGFAFKLFFLAGGAVVFVELVAEGADADVEDFGGMGAVAFATVQGREDMRLFELGEGGKRLLEHGTLKRRQ
jgi:hypothetical protein